METIRVNMTPCEDIKTIHASQNDNEGREWGFELHNNGEKIDSSSISDQLVFKAYKGGTEQILPENGSTPTTSPFIGDIKYPQGLLSDQEFLYRESPTEEDGLAKITDIKGNTLVWNQLFNTIPSSSSDGITTEYNATTHLFSITNDSRTSNYSSGSTRGNLNFSLVKDHKYFIRSSKDVLGVVIGESGGVFHALNTIFTAVADYGTPYIRITYQYDFVTAHPIGDVTSFYLNVFDLTAMGFDSITINEFTSLFPLSFYDFNQGSLLSFNGEQIKTVGKNLLNYLNSRNTNGITFTYGQSSGAFKASGTMTASDAWSDVGINGTVVLNYPRLRKGTYTITGFDTTLMGRVQAWYDDGTNEILIETVNQQKDFTLEKDAYVFVRGHIHGQGISIDRTVYPMITFQGEDQTFEPYTESISSLPTQQYFPSGMNGHGDTYDELTPIGATKRFEKNSLGDLTWTRRTTNIFSANLPSEFDASKDISCFMSNRLPTVFVSGYTLAEDGYISIYKTTTVTSSTSIYLNMTSQSIDTVADLQTWLSNNPTELVYPLATPTETSFTTASLVTENAEIPLSNDDGTLIGKCTEQLSVDAGFIEGKIKLSDEDGDVYSNKIQIHVERSPQ